MKKFCLLIAVLSYAIVSDGQVIKKIKITDLERTIHESKTPLIVTFWATYCIPCIQEIPHFQKTVKKYARDSVKLLLVSLDLREDYKKIKAFAEKRKFTAEKVWLNETNADYFCPKIDSAWSGAIPATLFINNKTGYRKFYEDPIKEDKLEKEIMAILGKTN